MKTLITLALLIFTTLALQAQSLRLAAGVEKTVAGSQYSSTLLFQIKSKWGLGAFYQTGLQKLPEGIVKKDPFYGGVLFAPLTRTEKITFYATLRCGVVNEKFLVVIPGLETQVRIFNRVEASFGMGYRMGYPSLSARVFTRIF